MQVGRLSRGIFVTRWMWDKSGPLGCSQAVNSESRPRSTASPWGMFSAEELDLRLINAESHLHPGTYLAGDLRVCRRLTDQSTHLGEAAVVGYNCCSVGHPNLLVFGFTYPHANSPMQRCYAMQHGHSRVLQEPSTYLGRHVYSAVYIIRLAGSNVGDIDDTPRPLSARFIPRTTCKA